MVTAPLIGDLFLLAGHWTTRSALFFLTLAYIAICIDASGLIRWLAFKVLQLGGEHGRRLFVYLYLFFFGLTSFVGNDPIVLSGTSFLAYFCRVSSNIKHPRAWIHMQFAVAHIGSAVLVSSNPANLVLAGAFQIKFLHYTANVIVPVIATTIVLLPFLLYIVFPYESLIPSKIELHQLPEEAKHKPSVNPNIPNARGTTEEDENDNREHAQQLSLEEIMNPFLDKGGAWFGAVIMAATLVTILALNASSQSVHEDPIFWITLSATFIMFCWDLTFGWLNRHETRKLAREGKEQIELSKMRRASITPAPELQKPFDANGEPLSLTKSPEETREEKKASDSGAASASSTPQDKGDENEAIAQTFPDSVENQPGPASLHCNTPALEACAIRFLHDRISASTGDEGMGARIRTWLGSLVNKTGTAGAIGGMGFLSTSLCNFAGTNIGTTILLCRVVQAWVQIHSNNRTIITQRTFWGTVYSMAIGVNYGAFSTAFSASLAGLLWRDILKRKNIRVCSLEFASVNLHIIAATMVVGLSVLTGEVYIVRDQTPYVGGGST
ncbi:hypothetical protein BST61_g11021 [Cercospora zeina]